jgi:hypothetical protein
MGRTFLQDFDFVRSRKTAAQKWRAEKEATANAGNFEGPSGPSGHLLCDSIDIIIIPQVSNLNFFNAHARVPFSPWSGLRSQVKWLQKSQTKLSVPPIFEPLAMILLVKQTPSLPSSQLPYIQNLGHSDLQSRRHRVVRSSWGTFKAYEHAGRPLVATPIKPAVYSVRNEAQRPGAKLLSQIQARC